MMIRRATLALLAAITAMTLAGCVSGSFTPPGHPVPTATPAPVPASTHACYADLLAQLRDNEGRFGTEPRSCDGLSGTQYAAEIHRALNAYGKG